MSAYQRGKIPGHRFRPFTNFEHNFPLIQMINRNSAGHNFILCVVCCPGDPHASERIGPSCSRTQGAITIAQLVASLKGAELEQINAMQEKLLPLVNRYHGRAILFDWMKQQIEDAIYKKQDVTPYPEFIKTLVRNNAIELNDTRTHTKEYLFSYNRGLAHPPVHYYRKVAKKDKVEELFSGEDLENFKRIIEE